MVYIFVNLLQSVEDEYLEMLIEQEKLEHDHYCKVTLNEQQQNKKAKVKNKEALIDELVRLISWRHSYKVKEVI